MVKYELAEFLTYLEKKAVAEQQLNPKWLQKYQLIKKYFEKFLKDNPLLETLTKCNENAESPEYVQFKSSPS